MEIAKNLFLFLNRIVYPMGELSIWRAAFALIGLLLLLYGLIWKDK